MNRRHIGSSVGSSGEGVRALSCSLFENFTPSDEPTPKHLYTVGSSSAEEIFPSSQIRAQLLRRVLKIGRRTIRCPISPRSSVALMVRPTLLVFYRRFIRRSTEAWVLLVISVGGRFELKPYFSRPPRPRPYAAFLSASGDSPRVCVPAPPLSAYPCSPPSTAPLPRTKSCVCAAAALR
jgi:hypothetical protein